MAFSCNLVSFVTGKRVKLESMFRLNAAGDLKVGDPVTVDGMMGRGVIVAINGNRIVIRFRSGAYVSRNPMFVHKIGADYRSPYYSGKK